MDALECHVGCALSCFAWVRHLGAGRQLKKTGIDGELNIGVVRALRRYALERRLCTSDPGLVDRVLTFLETRPPFLAAIQSGEIQLGLTKSATQLGLLKSVPQLSAGNGGNKKFGVMVVDSSGQMALAAATAANRSCNGTMAVFLFQFEPVGKAPLDTRTFDGSLCPVTCLWLDISKQLMAAGHEDTSLLVWDVFTQSVMLTCTTYSWVTPHGCMEWGHEVKISAISCSPRSSSCICSADIRGVVCLWGAEGGRTDVHPQMCATATEEPILQLSGALPGIVICGCRSCIVGIAAQDGQDVQNSTHSISFKINMDSAPSTGIFWVHRCESDARLIAATVSGAMLCWDLFREGEVYVARRGAKELCYASPMPTMNERPLACASLHTLCWFGRDASSSDSSAHHHCLRWLEIGDIGDMKTYPCVREAMFSFQSTHITELIVF